MKLFGRKQKNGELNKSQKKKKRKKKIKVPADVKAFYYLPISVLIATILIVSGIGMALHNNHEYKQRVMASSMKYGTELPLWGGESNGILTLGHTKLSADGKTLAAEIKYDEDAHSSLSSFGNRYGLRLVDTDDNRMHVSMKYGLFGSDGSGVLTIHSKTGFKDKAFVVMIIDKGGLITDEELSNTDGSSMSDEDIDKSITSQLSNAQESSSSEAEDNTKVHLPPLYYVRLNAKTTKKSKHNWKNDRDIVDDLFVNDNLKALSKQEHDIQSRYVRGQKTLIEMQRRLKENPDDKVSQDNEESIRSSLADLKAQLSEVKRNQQKIKNSTIKVNVLDPEQHKYETFTRTNLNELKGE